MTEPVLQTSAILAPTDAPTAPPARRRPRAERKADESAGRGAVKFSLVVSAVRCTITYLLLPLWAPISTVTSVMKPVEFTLHVLAIVSVGYGVRRFWRSGHRFKWYYLALAITVTFISAIAIVKMVVPSAA
jgi:hypothetical protein